MSSSASSSSSSAASSGSSSASAGSSSSSAASPGSSSASAGSSSSSAASSGSSSASAGSSSSSAASSGSSSASAGSSSSSAAASGPSSPPGGSSSSSAESPGSSSPPGGSSSSSAASPGSSSPPAGSSSSSAASPGSSSAASSNSGGNSSKAVAATAASAVVGAILLTLIAVLIIKLIRKNKMKGSSRPSTIEGATTPSGSSDIVLFLEDISTDNPRRFSSKELKEITGNYTKELGAGTFGRVYEGRLKKCEMLVAVKVLQGSVDSSVEAQFIAEVGTMYRTNHINLVKLLGFCFDTEVKALVCEYMENGSLDHYLSSKKGCLEFEKLYEIAVGTARGIRYLHEECQKMIIHYDIKPGNVLLTRDFSPKVGDFGLAELLDREATVPLINQGKGTSGFAAPEVAFSFTRKSDVYSFGMLLFQILGSKRNMEGKRAENQLTPRRVWDSISKGGVASILSLCGIEDENCEKAERMCRVALMCVRYQSETRPSMSSVLRMLEGKEEIDATVSPFNIWVPSPADRETEVSAGDYQPVESWSK